MIELALSAVTKANLDALLDNAVPESRRLEYKEELPGSNDDAKREFLKDVSALANSAGGDIIFGVKEKRDADGKPSGIADSILGLSANLDAEILRLESIIRDGLDPRLPGVQFKQIQGFPIGPVLILHVSQSLASPHMITFKSYSRFFARTSAGTYQLDVREIGDAFKVSSKVQETIKNFREARITAIRSNQMPIPMDEGPKYVVHVIPVSTFASPNAVDIERLGYREILLAPLNCSAWNTRMNIDGCLSFGPDETHKCLSYAQFYRNGVAEFVDAKMFRRHGNSEADNLIPGPLLERQTVMTVQRIQEVYAKLGIDPPIAVFATMLNVNGFSMAGAQTFPDELHFVDRDDLVFPDVMVDSLRVEARILGTMLRPIFDAVWQSAGHPGSTSYTRDGTWNVRM